jgi:hypothetical protein
MRIVTLTFIAVVTVALFFIFSIPLGVHWAEVSREFWGMK